MGSLFSSRRANRSDIEMLNQRFLSLSQEITRVLPLVNLLRNGAAVLLVTATMFMLVAMCKQTGTYEAKAAGILLIAAVLSHLTTFILRELKIIKTRGLLEEFREVTPSFLGQSTELKGEKLFYVPLLTVEVFSLVVGFFFPVQISISVITFILMLLIAVGLLLNILKGMDDFVWVNTCLKCAKFLQKMLDMQGES